MLVDSHAHFDLMREESGCREIDLVAGLSAAGIQNAVQVGIDVQSSSWSFEFAKKFRDHGIFFTCGIHPSSKSGSGEQAALEKIAGKIMQSDYAPLLFGIGECGLDYYRLRQPREKQHDSFEFQIGLAKKFNLPVIVHSRDAMDDCYGILKSSGHRRGIMHCFQGNRGEAKRLLDLGFYISFAGNVTYKTASELQNSASFIPQDRLLIETDSPFLTPVPNRGKKNRPEYIVHTYAFIAALRNEPPQELSSAVYRNFLALTKKEGGTP